jgi:hypothetical protein
LAIKVGQICVPIAVPIVSAVERSKNVCAFSSQSSGAAALFDGQTKYSNKWPKHWPPEEGEETEEAAATMAPNEIFEWSEKGIYGYLFLIF